MNKKTKSGSGSAVPSSELLADSPTWPYVLAFAKRMEAKLAKNRHKGDRHGWINSNPDELAYRIQDELAELNDALRNVRRKCNILPHERQPIIDEAADVANFAMMIADIYGGCEPKAANDQRFENANRFAHIREIFTHCPHAEIIFNDDPDVDEPLGWTIRIEGCETDEVTAETLEECVDKHMASIKSANDQAQRPGLTAGVERNNTKGKSNE